MNLLRCALGIIPCGRLMPETPYEVVGLLFIVAFSLFELLALAALVLLPAAAIIRGVQAWRSARTGASRPLRSTSTRSPRT